jgi:DNA processing protein
VSKIHWLAFSAIPGVGGATARRLVERFGGIEEAFAAEDEELGQIPRMTPEVISRLRTISLEALESELASLSEEGLAVLTWDDNAYPQALAELSDAPPILFVRGEILPEDERAIAIIGTRQPSESAVEIAISLARELASRGFTIVSGLALGIDTAAHRGALKADGGRTLAVPGSGLRVIHPRENIPLAEKIVRRGALLSELHPNTPPRGPQLMARDRIVSGLSRAVIVVEAGEKSGTLDTAEKAVRQKRPLYAIPGSAGADLLLRQGAIRLDREHPDLDSLCARLNTEPTPTAPKTQLSLF